MKRSVVAVLGWSLIVNAFVAGAELPGDFQLESPPGPYATRVELSKPAGVVVKSGTPTIATTYFYWYDEASKSHIIDNDGTDALTEHPPTIEGLSYKNVDWHYDQLSDMIDAGIDVIMPVYWGGPFTSFPWSDEGLPPLVQARDKLLAEGKSPPAIGMFYDTSTLHANAHRYHVDLTKPAGHRWFYGTVRNFFSLIPEKHRVLIDGKPLVILYADAFAKDVDESLFPAVRQMFRDEFGGDIYLVKHQGWPGESDSIYSWGAAMAPKMLDTAAIGPGYDHSAVPGRTPLVRQRDSGQFYKFGWKLLLSKDPATRPWLLHIETWNEYHEGTQICETLEYGRQYIDMTRHFADRFHAGEQISTNEIRRGPDHVWATPDESHGVAQFAGNDGPVVIKNVEGHPAWCSQKNASIINERYVYFDVDYRFLYDADDTVRVVIEFLDDGPKQFRIEYDSADPTVDDLEQMFRDSTVEKTDGSSTWKRVEFELPNARFAGRANGADFRLSCRDADLVVRRIEVTRDKQ